MPQMSAEEFERVPLRVHEFLAGVPLHDVWAVDLPRLRPGITLDEFLRAAGALPFKPSQSLWRRPEGAWVSFESCTASRTSSCSR